MYSFTGQEQKLWFKPCVYAWLRQRTVLYVGCSLTGFQRPLQVSHNVIRKMSPLMDNDRVNVFLVKDKLEMDYWETVLLLKLRPRFNRSLRAHTWKKRLQYIQEPMLNEEITGFIDEMQGLSLFRYVA